MQEIRNKFSDVKSFLLSAREADLQCEDTQELVQHLDLQCRKITPTLSDMPKGGGDGGAKDAALAALCDARDELLRRSAYAAQLKLEIGDFIDRVPGRSVHRAVLRRRYLHGESWRQVERWLKRHGEFYEERQIYNIHGEALQSARKQWDKEKNNEDSNGGEP